MILNEKMILTADEVEKYYKLSGMKKTKFINQIVKKYFEDDLNYYEMNDLIVQSIQQSGFDTNRNKFLDFAVRKKNIDLGNDFTFKKAMLVKDILENSDISSTAVNNTNYWLYKPVTYKGPDYKIKALAFLSSPRANNFGDIKKKPVKAIEDATTEEEIKNILDVWQTKNGEPTYSAKRKSTTKNTSTQNIDVLKQKLVDRLTKTTKFDPKNIVSAVNRVYTNAKLDPDKVLADVFDLLDIRTENVPENNSDKE